MEKINVSVAGTVVEGLVVRQNGAFVTFDYKCPVDGVWRTTSTTIKAIAEGTVSIKEGQGRSSRGTISPAPHGVRINRTYHGVKKW